MKTEKRNNAYISTIYKEEVSSLRNREWNYETVSLVERIKTFEGCKSQLYRERSKDRPVLPSRRQDIHLEVEWTETSAGEQFLLIDEGEENRMLVIATQENLEHLCNTRTIYADGTFYTCSGLFYQLYTWHCFMDGQMYPLMLAFLPVYSRLSHILYFGLKIYVGQSGENTDDLVRQNFRMDNKKVSSLAEDVYRFACTLAIENSVDVGQVLLQAVGLCMNTNKNKLKQSYNEQEKDPPCTSTSSNKYDGTEEISSSDNLASSSYGTDIAGTEAKSLSHNENVLEIPNKEENEAVADVGVGVLVRPANKEPTISVEDIPNVIKLDDEVDKDLTTKEHDRTEDYFDMDCEEIDETVEEEKGNDISDNMKKETSNDHEVFIIDDDEDENCLHEKASIEKSTKICDNETKISAIGVKEAEEPTSRNGGSTNTHPNSIDIIDLDSESEDESDKSGLNNVHKAVSHSTTSTVKMNTQAVAINEQPVSIVGIFTNKSQLQSTNIDTLSIDEKSRILETNPSSATMFGDLTGSDIDSKFRDEVDSLNALGLVPINNSTLVSSKSEVDRHAHKRLFTEMASDLDGLTFQQEANREEGSTSPRIKKRLLDFDKKWHMGPKYSPEQDRYLARPGGIDANVYIREMETRMMPSVSHMNGAQFRNPGLYTSVSTCSPNVVIEALDSNLPVNYNWHNCCNSHNDQNHYHHHQDDDESVESNSSFSDTSFRSYQRTRSNKSTKSSRLSSVSHLQKARKKLMHSLDDSHDIISERSRGRGKKRKISDKRARGNKLLNFSVGRGSTLGNKKVNVLSIGRGRGSRRGRGRILSTNSTGRPRGRPRGRGASLSQNVPSRSTGSDSNKVIRGRGSYRGKRGRGSSVRGRGNKKASGSGVYAASLLNSAKKQLNRKDNHKQSLVETENKKHNDSITKRGRGKNPLPNKNVFRSMKMSDNAKIIRKKLVLQSKEKATHTGKTMTDANEPVLLGIKPKRGRPRKIQVLDNNSESTKIKQKHTSIDVIVLE